MRRFTILFLLLILMFLISCKQDPKPLEFSKEDGPIRNVILVIGDGMGQAHVNAGNAYLDGGLAFYSWDKVLVNTDSVDSEGKRVTTDSAAAATALATGVLTINSHVGTSPSKDILYTIMDYAKVLGKATGIVTSDSITGATPAGFSGHSNSRYDDFQIFNEQVYSSNVDFFCASSIPSGAGSDAIQKLQNGGYVYSNTMQDLKASADGTSRICSILDLATVDAKVQLNDAVTVALEYLDQDEDGFVLMVEQAYIDKYSHSNNMGGMLGSMDSISKTVKTIADWIGDRSDTILLVTADHETGGLSVSETENLGNNVSEQDGDTLYYSWSRTSHSNSPVFLFAYGQPVQQYFQSNYSEDSVIKNTEVFRIMLDCIGNRLKTT